MTSTTRFSLHSNMHTIDFSQLIGTSPVQVFTSTTLQGRILNYLRIWNVSPTATIWCCRNGGDAAVNGAGSFPLGPGLYEVFVNPQQVPDNPLSIIATAVSTPVTIEVG